MAGGKSNTSRVRRESLLISEVDLPGWIPGGSRQPELGEVVHTVNGRAEVVRVLGKVGDGSRLLELRLDTPDTPPFFAASSNVLVKDSSAKKSPRSDDGTD